MRKASMLPVDQTTNHPNSVSNANYTNLSLEDEQDATRMDRPTAATLEEESMDPSATVSKTTDVQETKPEKARSKSTTSTQLPMRSRITIYILLVMVICTVVILATVAFVTFIWFSSDSNPHWRILVVSNWIPRSITLSALLLRISISLQAGVTTSMLAALAMESRGIRLIDSLEMSAVRISNAGPHKALWIYTRLKQNGSLLIFVLLGTSTLSTLAIQFLSTILLSDVVIRTTIGLPITRQIPYGFSSGDAFTERFMAIGANMNFWNLLEQGHPLFAEYSVPAVPEEGLDDTGTVIRSFIPVADRFERETIVEYDGPALTFDARVVCHPPEFVSLRSCGAEDGQDPKLCGRFAAPPHVENAVLSNITVGFECQIPRASECTKSDCSSAPWILCRLQELAGGLIPSLDPMTNDSLQISWEERIGYWYAQNGNHAWVANLGSSYLVMNASTDIFYVPDNSSKELNLKETPITIDKKGPWKTVETVVEVFSDINITTKFCATLCHTALAAYQVVENFNISLTSPTSTRNIEAEVSWDPITETYDTLDLRKQLGANLKNRSIYNRGVWNLSTDVMQTVTRLQSEWDPNGHIFEPYSHLFQPSAPWVVTAVLSPTFGSIVYFCYTCYMQSGTVNPFLTSIFKETLNDTGSPALGLQAAFTTVIQIAYYAWLPSFNIEMNATTTSLVDRLAPTSHRGYWVAMGIILTHILVCVTTVILFFTRTELSLLDNTWSAFAQIANSKEEEVQSILRDATMKSDREIERELKSRGGMRKRYRIVATAEGDGAELAAVGGVGAREV